MSLPLKELINIGREQLSSAGVLDAEIDAKELYCHLMGLDRVGLMMSWQDIVQDNRCEAYFDLIQQRASRIPLQHITGIQEFMGLSFQVNEDVLIPRQDTETMVEDALELIEKGSLRGVPYGEGKGFHGTVQILDLCCGSGAIGISLSHHLPSAKVTFGDISPKALTIAKKNAEYHKCKQVKFVESDLFEDASFHRLGKAVKYHFIISNPPYIESSVIAELEPEVKDHEPRIALDGGADGLDFYRKIVEQAASHLKKNGILMMEIGYNQNEKVIELLKETGKYKNILGLRDLTGRDRIVVGTFADK